MSGEVQQAPLWFLSIWLVGWSIGVAVIQSMVISGDWSTLLFLFTHGGAEVLVLVVVANQLRTGATTGSSLPDLELEHDGLVARWTVGAASRLRGLGAAVLGVVAHVVLVLGIASGVSEGTDAIGWIIAVAALMVWAVTAVVWTRGVVAQLRGRSAVTLHADLDGVEVTTRQGTHRFELSEVDVSSSPGVLTVRGRGEQLVLPCVNSNEKNEIVEMIGLMSGRGDDRLAVPVPESLASMRSQADPERGG